MGMGMGVVGVVVVVVVVGVVGVRGGNGSSRFEPDPAVTLVDGTRTQQPTSRQLPTHFQTQRGQYGIKLTGRAYKQPTHPQAELNQSGQRRGCKLH